MGDRQALPEGRRRFASPDATYFSHVGKVGKRTLRGMKLSDLIAKGRRTVLKISPPKNPRKFTGAVIRTVGQLSAARGHRMASALATTDVDPALALDFAAFAPRAASWQYLLLRWGSRTLTADARPGRRGPGGESAGIIAQAAPSGAEGAESGAEARRHPCAGKRTLHFAVRPWGT